MKYIKTYEGLFDFFKKVGLEQLRNKIREVLSDKVGLEEETITDFSGINSVHGRIRGYKWIFSEKGLAFDVVISDKWNNYFHFKIGCQSIENEDLSDYISFDKTGEELLKDLDFHIKYNIKDLGDRLSKWLESEEFFSDHPKDEIRDYLVDLKDTLGDDITLSKEVRRYMDNIIF